MNDSLLIAMLVAAVVATTPLIYAALGEMVAELSGVMNLSVEGLMMVGAMFGFMFTYLTGNPWIGLLVGVTVSTLLSLVFAVFTVSLRVNQVVAGLAMVVFNEGFARFFGKSYVGSSASHIFTPINIPVLSDIPFIGQIFFQHNILVYLTYIMMPIAWFLIYRTQLGLNLRAVGERPRSAEVVGINVFRYRYLGVAIGGALAGVAGVFLSVGYVNGWTEGMVAGRGWIALALVMVAGWNPGKLVAAGYIFGFAWVAAFQSQTIKVISDHISSYVVQMMPYFVTIFTLAVMARLSARQNVGSPASLSLPYDREER